MFLKRSFSLQRHIAASLAGAGLISYFCGPILRNPVGVEALSVVGRFFSVQNDKQNNASTKLLKHYTDMQTSRTEGLSFVPFVSRSMSSTKAYCNIPSREAMTCLCSTPKWATDTFKVTHAAFEKIREAFIPELGLAAVVYRHLSTGVKVVSLATDAGSGREMCFDVIIPTPPVDDCGCPHILEHSVLEGSKKYPSKGGFARLLQGGFQSFVNAFTYKDRTSYLFASTNEKDFYITADFYMNAVFQPNIRSDSRIFRQEAWHYKVTKCDPLVNRNEDDSIILHDHHISYGGVVYSEMQKAYSDPISRGQDIIYQGLYTNSYRFDSGGNPEHIVQLNYQDLVKFYELYYGPETASIYFYGPDDVNKRLQFVDTFFRENGITSDSVAYTATFETAKNGLKLEAYKELNEVLHGTFGSSGCKNEDILFTGWILDPQHEGSKSEHVEGKFKIDIVDALGMEVLEHLLMGTPESLLYKALIKSGLGKKVVGSGLTNYFKQSNFIIGLAGVDCEKFGSKESAISKFEDVVVSSFTNIVKNGIKKEAIDASMNYIEFQLRELNTGTFPKGLMIVNLIQSQSQYQRDPFEHLYFDSIITQLKSRVHSDTEYFPNLVAKHFLSNKHKVTVHMEALDPHTFERRTNEAIRNELMKRLGNITKTNVEDMEVEYAKFKAECDDTGDRGTLNELPTLSLEDINHENELIPTIYYKLGSPKVYDEAPAVESDCLVVCHPMESQGIVYLDLAISLEDITLDEIKYLDLFCSMLKEAGTHNMTSEDLTYHISTNLGGLATSFSFMTAANGRKHSKRNNALGYVYIRAKALREKADDMVDIVLDILESSNFDNMEKGLEIIKRRINQVESDLTTDGHMYAARRLMSGFSVADYATEVSSGYSYLVALKNEIQPKAENQWSYVLTKLEGIRSKLIALRNAIINVTASPDIVREWLEPSSALLARKINRVAGISNHKGSERNWVAEVIKKGYNNTHDEVIVAPTNVNFVGMGGPLFNEENVNGADDLLLHYISTSYLWKQIRMTLGAYGVFCNMSSCGDVVFMSYADPNFNQTLQVYRSVPSAIADALESLDKRELLRQKIGKISSIDKPLPVDARGFLALNRIIRGETDDDRQLYREDILNATIESFERLHFKMANSTQWHKVCAVVNQTTANALPNTFVQIKSSS
ncbi:putative presequence protease [Babesia sp. Xinjiang]|uniref:putative presequence protease n=1 Tax=Babesia sp. Xinjiang TaxID=462227 RepID=UPI000A241BBA|nr:putative presequence protease [Babesia sp. Xinjiang]ORM40780.1 putative presequence protease [Babesia sp. Xinjiang]